MKGVCYSCKVFHPPSRIGQRCSCKRVIYYAACSYCGENAPNAKWHNGDLYCKWCYEAVRK